MVEDSTEEFGHLFPDLKPVPMDTLVGHYVDCVEGEATGRIVRAYG